MKTCINCARKHLARAFGYIEESLLGYPIHRDLAIGELSLAESELVRQYPDLANYIRGLRLKMLNEDAYVPDLLEIFEMLHGLKQTDESDRTGKTE